MDSQFFETLCFLTNLAHFTGSFVEAFRDQVVPSWLQKWILDGVFVFGKNHGRKPSPEL